MKKTIILCLLSTNFISAMQRVSQIARHASCLNLNQKRSSHTNIRTQYLQLKATQERANREVKQTSQQLLNMVEFNSTEQINQLKKLINKHTKATNQLLEVTEELEQAQYQQAELKSHEQRLAALTYYD